MVDASPEAEYLLVNGHKMASAGFHQGDEVRILENRIFMINEASGPAPVVRPPRDDVTRVQPPAFMPPPAAGQPIKRGSWRERLEAPMPSSETSVIETEPQARSAGRGARKPAAETPAEPPARGWARLIFLFTSRANTPGQERVLSSPLVFGLGVTLAALILVGFALHGIISRTVSNRLFDTALANLDDGDYRNAIKRFDEFIAQNAGDPRLGKARVHRAMANVRQYTASAGASWSLALEAQKAMLDSVGGEESYRDSSTELAELVVKTGEMLADRARTTGDAKALGEAESAVGLHAKVAGKAGEPLLKKSRLPEKLVTARAAVRKDHVRRAGLAAMESALKAGSSAGVYAARDALVEQYADQAEDRELLAHMNSANDLIKSAVTIDQSGRPGETEPHPDALGPATTLVLRTPDAGASGGSTANADNSVVFALADGVAYGIEGASGKPLWQVPVGLSSPYPPQPVPGTSTVLAVDTRYQELVRLDQRTGSLVWRQSLEGPVIDPPLVLGNQVIQATPAGQVLIIDLLTGALRTTINLGMPLARSPVGDESGQALYVVAEKDCLFVLTREPLACAEVIYLGHGPGSVLCPPARVGRYLVVPDNAQIGDGRWKVFLLAEDGTRLKMVQQLPLIGWTWGTPAASGSVIWASPDQGGVAAYAVGAYGERDPFRLIARINADRYPSGPAFAIARSERELLVGSGRSARYELDAEHGKIGTTWTLGEAGPALAPPQTAGSRLVLTQQYADGPGIALWCVDPLSGNVAWRTALGTRWVSPPAPSADRKALTSLGIDGRVLTLSAETLAAGGFIEAPLPRRGGFRLPAGALARVEGEDWTAVIPSRKTDKLLVRSGSAEFKEIGLPAPLGAKPVAWGRELLVPGEDGRAYLIDVLTGAPVAEPFVPPFDRSRQTHWKSPVLLGAEAVALADEAGVVRRIVRKSDPRPRLVVAAEIAMGTPLAADPVSTSGAVVVATSDNKVRSLSIRDLSPAGSWTLDNPVAVPPAAIGGRCFVVDTSGVVLALGEDGQKLWSANLRESETAVWVVGAPAIRGDAVWFLDRTGTLHGRG